MADIQAKTVSIAGGYKGKITADRVELLEGGRLWGTIVVRTFLLDEGAQFHGELIMQTDESDDQLLAQRPPAGAQIPVDDRPKRRSGITQATHPRTKQEARPTWSGPLVCY